MRSPPSGTYSNMDAWNNVVLLCTFSPKSHKRVVVLESSVHVQFAERPLNTEEILCGFRFARTTGFVHTVPFLFHEEIRLVLHSLLPVS